MIGAVTTISRVAKPTLRLGSAARQTVGAAAEFVERMVGEIKLHHSPPQPFEPGRLGATTMPSSAGVVQEAGVPLRPSISTRHSRQEPNASRLSVAQSFGIGLSTSAAAAITDVPAGTLTFRPSMVRVKRHGAGANWRADVEFL